MNITTNHQWRTFVPGYELTFAEREDFDYLDDIDAHDFIRYRGSVIDPGEFMRIDQTMLLHDSNAGMERWQCYQSDSYFSGLLIRFSGDGEEYQIARYSV